MPGSQIILNPPLLGVVPSGTTSWNIASALSIPVTAGTRCLLGFTVFDSGGSTIVVEGYLSGGITID